MSGAVDESQHVESVSNEYLEPGSDEMHRLLLTNRDTARCNVVIKLQLTGWLAVGA